MSLCTKSTQIPSGASEKKKLFLTQRRKGAKKIVREAGARCALAREIFFMLELKSNDSTITINSTVSLLCDYTCASVKTKSASRCFPFRAAPRRHRDDDSTRKCARQRRTLHVRHGWRDFIYQPFIRANDWLQSMGTDHRFRVNRSAPGYAALRRGGFRRSRTNI